MQTTDTKFRAETREEVLAWVAKIAPIHLRLFQRIYSGLGTPRQGIRAFCLLCNGFPKSDLCNASECPLWGHRPYRVGQDAFKGSENVCTAQNLTEKQAIALKQVSEDAPGKLALFESVFCHISTPRKVIKAKCLECTCHDECAIGSCSHNACPIWQWRPYQHHKAKD